MDVVRNLMNEDFNEGYKVSYYLRNRFQRNLPSTIVTSENINYIVDSFTDVNFIGKTHKFLFYISSWSSFPGASVKINSLYDFPIIGAKNWEEMRFIISELEKKNLLEVERFGDGEKISLTMNGWEKIEEIEKNRLDSSQAFVAMRFTESMDSIYTNAIKPAIEESQYFPFRIDSKQHNNKICDEIIIEIRRSKFLVADVTELRGGIYFEAGYAMGLGMPVIWTCREDKIHDVHFDTRQYNHIVWKDEKDLCTQLKNRIQATIFVT
jgi:nucleoside 2-deoxyribosyltransferase